MILKKQSNVNNKKKKFKEGKLKIKNLMEN